MQPDQIGILFVFLARQVSHRQDDQHLRVNKLLIHQIVEYLTTPAGSQEDGAKHEEKQQVICRAQQRLCLRVSAQPSIVRYMKQD